MMKTLLRNILSLVDRNVIFQPSPLIFAREQWLEPNFRMVAEHLLEGNEKTFLIVGAFDGISNDEVYPLVRKHHWRGIALEPQPFAFRSLVDAYRDEPQVTLINAALDWAGGTREMFAVKAANHTDQYSPQLASFDREVVLRYPSVTDAEIESFQVDCITVAECMARANLGKLDLLQVDTEGFDFEVIKMVDGIGIRPTVIRYEHQHLSRKDSNACLRFLLQRKYHICRSTYDTIAALMPE